MALKSYILVKSPTFNVKHSSSHIIAVFVFLINHFFNKIGYFETIPFRNIIIYAIPFIVVSLE